MEDHHTQGDNFHNEYYRDDVSDDDDNCIVFFSGESNSNEKHNIEFGSDDGEYCYSNKRQSVKRGKY